jgi:hypothetical protein
VTSKRRKWVILAGCAAFAAAAFLVLKRPSEPSYVGHSLSQWAKWAASTPPPAGLPVPPSDAIRHIGTNAIPYALKWIAESDTGSAKYRLLFWAATRLPKTFRPRGRYEWAGNYQHLAIAREGVAVFRALGPASVSAIPQLENMAFSNQSLPAVYSVDALFCIGPEAIPALERIPSITNYANPVNVSAYIAEFRRTSAPRVIAPEPLTNAPPR